MHPSLAPCLESLLNPALIERPPEQSTEKESELGCPPIGMTATVTLALPEPKQQKDSFTHPGDRFFRTRVAFTENHFGLLVSPGFNRIASS